MVRKTVFSREDVVAAGVAVIAKDGLTGLSARRVAEEMGASTAPVYSNFANMDELAIAVKMAVTDQILEFTARRFTDDEFLNLGIGVLEFARQQPGLYSAVFMQPTEKCEAGPRLMAALAKRMASLESLSELPESERVMLLHVMGIFTHGLAVQISTGLAEPLTFEDFILFLEEAGEAMIRHALSRPKRTAEQTTLMQSLMDINLKEYGAHE